MNVKVGVYEMNTTDLKKDLDELLYRAWKYDDKPHQLYSHIQVLALKYVQDEIVRDEIVRLMDLEYERDRFVKP